MPSSNHYPLALGNTWTYQVKGGQAYTITVTEQNGDTFAIHTTMINAASKVKRVGNEYHSDSPEAGKTMVSFKENLKVGDAWQSSFVQGQWHRQHTDLRGQAGRRQNLHGRDLHRGR